MLKIIAHIEVVPEYLEEVLAIQLEAVKVTQAEPGCLEYSLFQQVDAPNQLTFVETWASEEEFKIHSGSPFLAEKGQRLAGKIRSKDVRVMRAL